MDIRAGQFAKFPPATDVHCSVNTTQIAPLSPFQIAPLKNDFKKVLKKPAIADRKNDKELLSCRTKI
ncbi:hypothetical protein, partial [Ferruginibacter sp.]|uniref:hypothetical protein n=1 Tax=Ferruginibacter sp. TaxID=1940288 RepID=UPI00265AE1CF